MKRHLICSTVLVFSIAACSSPGAKNQAKGSFEYAERDQKGALKTPENLKKPRQFDHYAISDKVNMQGKVGAELDIRAPALVLPLSTGSRVELDDTGAIIWLDQVDDTAPLVQQVKRAMETYFTEKSIDFTVNPNDELIYETSWIERFKDAGFWFWTTREKVDGARYVIKLAPKPHGRSLALSAQMTSYQNGSDDIVAVDAIEQQREEVNLINNLVGQLSYQYRKDLFDRQQAINTADMVKIGTSADGILGYIVQMPVDSVWENMPAIFEKYGFKQTDLDESNQVYYVDYEKPDSGFWDSVWGKAKPMLNLENASYQFRLSTIGKHTAVVLTDKDNKPLSEDKINELFEVLAPAFLLK